MSRTDISKRWKVLDLGIEVDEDQVRKLSGGAQVWRNPRFIGPDGEIREW